MSNYNRVLLMGNLTRDPELKYLPSNTAVCEFGVATNRRYKDRDGNVKEEVTFVEVAAFARTAEVIQQYMTKGKPIFIEGRLRFDQWTAQDGSKRSRLTVVAENFQFVGGRGEGGGAPAGGGGGYNQPRAQPAPRAAQPYAGAPPQAPPAAAPQYDAPPAPDYGPADEAQPYDERIPF